MQLHAQEGMETVKATEQKIPKHIRCSIESNVLEKLEVVNTEKFPFGWKPSLNLHENRFTCVAGERDQTSGG